MKYNDNEIEINSRTVQDGEEESVITHEIGHLFALGDNPQVDAPEEENNNALFINWER